MQNKTLSILLLTILSLSLIISFIPLSSAVPTITITHTGDNYICSGLLTSSSTEFLTQLRLAIAALPNGGSIYLPSTLYEVNITSIRSYDIITKYVSAFYVSDGIELYGSGSATTEIRQIGVFFGNATENPEDVYLTYQGLFLLGSHVKLHDLTINGNAENLQYMTYQPNNWYNLVLAGVSNEWIGVDIPATNTYIYNCVFEHTRYESVPNMLGIGLNLMHGLGIAVENCVFWDCQAGIFITYQPTIEGAFYTYSSNYYNIKSCYTMECYTGIYWEMGSATVDKWNSQDDYFGMINVCAPTTYSYGYVKNSYINNSLHSCISNFGALKWWNLNNVTMYCQSGIDAYYALSLTGDTGSIYSLNDVYVHGGWGFNSFNGGVGTINWVNGAITESLRNGVHAWVNLNMYGVTITDNGKENSTNAYTDNGLYLADNSSYAVRYNIQNCIISDNYNCGIRIENVRYAMIVNNIIHDNGAYGVIAVDCDYNTYANNNWADNHGAQDAVISGDLNSIYGNIGRGYYQIISTPAPATPTPSPIPTPTPDAITAFINTLNANWQLIAVVIIYVVITAFCTYLFAFTGLIAGIDISTVICLLLGWLGNLLYLVVGLVVIVNIALIVLGSGLLNKRKNGNDA